LTTSFRRIAALRALAVYAAVCIAQFIPASAAAAELVMFDGKWCGRCKQFLAEVAPVYHTTPPGKAMPLRVVDLQQTRPWFRVSAPVEGTPTFVLVDKGAELGRITGYTTREAFLQQSYQLMALLQRAPVPRARPPRTRDVYAQAKIGRSSPR
jgi:thiol-disulfide isomerase/thioredoxin